MSSPFWPGKKAIFALIVVSLIACTFIYFNSIRMFRGQPNVILISLDTLRQDGVGLYLDRQPSPTPHLDAFGKNSIVYENAYAPMPFTPPSHMSMLTGFYPDVHSVNGDNLDPGMDKNRILPDSIKTLAEILKEKKYTTLGVYTSEWLKSGFGFGRGFDYYQPIPHTLTLAAQVTNKAINLLDTRKKKEQPFFLFLHYYDIHSDFLKKHPPYAAPEPYQIDGYKSAVSHFCDEQNICATQYLLKVNRTHTLLSDADISLLKALYSGGIKYTDAEVGRLFEALKERNLFKNTIIILTADHGEEFQEHGQLIHQQPYAESVHVPMMIKLPGEKNSGRRIKKPVGLIDIMPSVLAYLGMEVSPDVQGRNILPSDLFSENQNPTFILMQHKLKRFIYAARDDRFKVIYNLKTKKTEFYDLQNDPGETKNIAGKEPKTAQHLIDLLLAQVKYNRILNAKLSKGEADKQHIVLTDEEKKRLKSLGYVK